VDSAVAVLAAEGVHLPKIGFSEILRTAVLEPHATDIGPNDLSVSTRLSKHGSPTGRLDEVWKLFAKGGFHLLVQLAKRGIPNVESVELLDDELLMLGRFGHLKPPIR
jgi:hypothetical protein